MLLVWLNVLEVRLNYDSWNLNVVEILSEMYI